MSPRPSARPSPKKYTNCSPVPAPPLSLSTTSLCVVLMASSPSRVPRVRAAERCPTRLFQSPHLAAYHDRPPEQRAVHGAVDHDAAQRGGHDLLAVQLVQLAPRPPDALDLEVVRPLPPVAPVA